MSNGGSKIGRVKLVMNFDIESSFFSSRGLKAQKSFSKAKRKYVCFLSHAEKKIGRSEFFHK